MATADDYLTAELHSPFREATYEDDLAGDYEAFDDLAGDEEDDELETFESYGGDDYLLEVPTENEHPLAAVFPLPRLAFDALAKGGSTVAITIAIGAGVRDVNKLTNLVFWFRHPTLIGQKLRADQRELVQEWLQIRDQIVKPVLAGQTTPAAPPPPAPTPASAGGGRTSIPADGLRWYGPRDEETPELMAFMRKVYNLHVQKHLADKDSFVDTLPPGSLDLVENKQYARKDAAAKAKEMLRAARDELAASEHAGKIRIGVNSGYRSAKEQWGIWQGYYKKGEGGFPYYYRQTKAKRRQLPGGEHGDQAAAHLTNVLAGMVAAPGYSNHQDGLALDLGTGPVGGGLKKLKDTGWFHKWLKKNAHKYDFHPYWKEAWHWTYRPPGGGASEAWTDPDAGKFLLAGRLEVQNVPLLDSHQGHGPDLVLTWNAMAYIPSEIDVVVHLHGYSWDHMTLPKHMEVWAGLDLKPVDGASGSGRSQPTLTVLPRGHNTGVKVGKINKYTFPALTTKDGLTNLVDDALERFAKNAVVTKPKLGRLILTAHSGGGAPLMRILRWHDPQEVHVFDALYQDVTPLVDWARRHLEADRQTVQPGSYTPSGAMRVFYNRLAKKTKQFSLQVARALASDLRGASEAVRGRYRVESSTLGHWQIARQYGWRVLADASADVPDAARSVAGAKELELDASAMPFELSYETEDFELYDELEDDESSCGA